MENERVIEAPPDRNLLTRRYTAKAIELIESQNLPVPDTLRTDMTSDQYVFNAGKYFPAK